MEIKSKDTLIEPDTNGQYKIVAQDSTLPVAIFYGSYDQCLKWQKDNK